MAATQTLHSTIVNNGAETTVSGAYPSGWVPGRVQFAFVLIQASTSFTATPSGWNLVGKVENSGANATHGVWWKTSDAGDDTTPTWEFGVSDFAACTIIEVSGANITNPVDASVHTVDASASTNHTIPTLTSNLDDELLLHIWGRSGPTSGHGNPPTPWAEEIAPEYYTGGLDGLQLGAHSQVKAVAGTVSGATWTTGTASVRAAQNVIAVANASAATEALRPDTNTGGVATNLNSGVYDYTVIDDDPDSGGTDFLGNSTDPSAVQQTTSYFYADAQDGTTPSGFAGQLTNPANAVGSTETSQASTTGATQNSDYGSNFSFDEAAIASAIPAGNVIDAVEVDARQWANNATRYTVGIRLDSAAGTQIATEKTLTTLLTAAPTAGTAGTNNTFGESGDAWSTVPTRAQLVAAGLRLRVRARRTASQAATYTLDWVRIRATHSTVAQTINTEIRAPMSTPVADLATGASTGQVKVQVRKKGSGSSPTARIEVRNAAGTLLATALADTAVTNTATAGQILTGTFNQSVISDPADVVIWVVGTGAAGGLVEIGAVEWNAQITEESPVYKSRVGAIGISGL